MIAILLSLAIAAPGAAKSKKANNGSAPDSFQETTAGLRLVEGPWRAWAGNGRVLLELPQGQGVVGTLLLATALPAGLGSNPIGLDRGQLGMRGIVDLERIGDRVVVRQQNLDHRGYSDSSEERRAVEESFATSVLASLEVVHEDPQKAIVDVSPFLLTDLHGVAQSVDGRLDSQRSAVLADSTLAFERNLVFRSMHTFEIDNPSREVRSVVPDPRSATVETAQLWIALPPPGFEAKLNDPRSGFFGPAYADHVSAPRYPLVDGFAARHRTDEPLVYYVDPGTPEPMRSALLDGARWWSEAFEQAGVDYRVELLPDSKHPYDVDTNVIQWVHRATRGWSYGDALVDPRNGEILKGHVTLGSQRVRHDRLLFEALLGADGTGSGAADDPEQLALARLRQLAAHEVGHTLGIRHNFAASTSDRASVMDYPAPRISLKDGSFDTSVAYGVGVGPWDIETIVWGYGTSSMQARAEMPFLSDRDARPVGAAHPDASLWDNGENAAEELSRLLEVRAEALRRFGTNRVALGRPLSDLQDAFSLVYLLHRYQLTAAARSIGGVRYDYGVRGEGRPSEVVDAEAQRDALKAVLSALSAEALHVPQATAALLLPTAPGGGTERERLEGRAWTADPLAWAGTAASLVTDELLAPERLQRLVLQKRNDPSALGMEEVLSALWTAASKPSDPDLALELQTAVAMQLAQVSRDERAAPGVRARAHTFLAQLRLTGPRGSWLAAEIERTAEDPKPPPRVRLEAPPGPPIGCGW